ncbi:Aste57867_24753 [Aphanomyces stellatus]|uniref:Aste57867_24753 protein n=1 Tax=Aphanomyces stellatus TaxID=120398 RepID=A0A485LRD4_9STRA|nr:hypothetical protein As57867_024675 [Aphanomyces stellatus]VFU01389.1 Aste57867_24753 [Aphanomyces stellatus]
MIHSAQLNPHLVCFLCHGYLRDAHTLSECLHSFCKSCILRHFHDGARACPKCHADLGVTPKCVFDRTLHEIVDKLFPNLKDEDAALEREFYAAHGFEKQLLPSKAPTVENPPPPAQVEYPDVTFRLQPDTEVAAAFQLPPLPEPQLRLAGHVKVQDVLKVLSAQLATREVEVVCQNAVLQSDLSIHSIKHSVWKTSARMVWRYRKPHKEAA